MAGLQARVPNGRSLTFSPSELCDLCVSVVIFVFLGVLCPSLSLPPFSSSSTPLPENWEGESRIRDESSFCSRDLLP